MKGREKHPKLQTSKTFKFILDYVYFYLLLETQPKFRTIK